MTKAYRILKVFILLLIYFITIKKSFAQKKCYVIDNNTFSHHREDSLPIMCSNYQNYIPDISLFDDYSKLYFRINLHFFRRNDGTGIAQPTIENFLYDTLIPLVN